MTASLQVSERTIREIIRQWSSTGSIRTITATGPGVLGRPRALDFEAISYLRERIDNSPNLYLDEIKADLFETLGITIHASTISRTLKRFGITTKKISRRATERSEELRECYRLVTAGIPAECLVFTFWL
ncbi:hypothetical protein CTheo_8930 [Ceratobasidium theobromae]|uniref:Uncharacterized protein n=1 Tax=Ceratobasidium theobromae TaxID=1582974 RepID=A0A5N5Q873_9AGAM|nr:hypothetical protein CTheo_8930 [Ceratobasidium theobromae]